jgi:hypothetical protein
MVDTPPLTREQMTRLAGDLSDGYGDMFARSQSLLSRFNVIQSRMEQTADEEGLTVEEVSGVMAIDVASLGKAGVGTTKAVGQTGGELLGEKILASYERTLDELNSQGASAYLNRYLKPFMDAAVSHFDPKRSTWTQEMLLGRPAPDGSTASGETSGAEAPPADEVVDSATDNEVVDEKTAGSDAIDTFEEEE